MTRDDFRIGKEFYTATGKWRCTDIGTRVIVAIRLDKDDVSWYAGPPFAVAESVFVSFPSLLRGNAPRTLCVLSSTAAGLFAYSSHSRSFPSGEQPTPPAPNLWYTSHNQPVDAIFWQTDSGNRAQDTD